MVVVRQTCNRKTGSATASSPGLHLLRGPLQQRLELRLPLFAFASDDGRVLGPEDGRDIGLQAHVARLKEGMNRQV